jgi:glycerol-3-phosphate dehydrogenase
MKEYDILVIGGGIHGAGVLQAAAAAGHRCLLIERKGLASGTSSRSSKLIHGGLRYLESGQFRLVRESLHERSVMLKVAPELVKLIAFHIPVYRTTRRRPWQLKLGLFAYALLGGFDAATRFGTVPRAEWDRLDGLDTKGLQAVIRYYDGQTDDAELTRSVVDSAKSLGAEIAMPASFIEAELDEGGVRVGYEEGGQMLQCRARVMVNAAGPWAAHVARYVRPAIGIPAVDLVQGSHIVVPVKTVAGVYYVESPSDGRAVFLIPWHGGTMIGTTETPYQGEPEQVRPLPEEEEYLLGVARTYFPAFKAITREHVVERFAGLRVLPAGDASAFGRSRETMLITDRPARPRVLGIYGGKLTTWRATAGQVMDKVEASLPRRRRRAGTEDLELRRSV